MIESYLPTFGIVIGTAAIDSINPCAIGVLILMISVILSGKGGVGRMLMLGSLYIFAVFATYLIAGLGLIYFLSAIPLFVTEYISLFVGSFIIVAGLIEIKDFFWYGRGFSLGIPVYFTDKIHKFAKMAYLSQIIEYCGVAIHYKKISSFAQHRCRAYGDFVALKP